MKAWRSIGTAALAACVIASTSIAGTSGINLAWNECLSDGGTIAYASSCTATSGTEAFLVGSYVLGGDQPLKVGDNIRLTLTWPTATQLPAWWSAINPGSCRLAGLAASFDMSGLAQSTCASPWTSPSDVTGAITLFRSPPFAGGPANQARVLLSSANDPAVYLSAGVEFVSFRLLVQRENPNACSGCDVPAVISLDEITSIEADYSEQRLTNPIASACVGWQGTPAPGPCAALPAANVTWGRVKTLYR